MPKPTLDPAAIIPPGDITEVSFCPCCGQGYVLPYFAQECAATCQRPEPNIGGMRWP